MSEQAVDMTERCPTCGETCVVTITDGEKQYETVTLRLFKDNAIAMDKLRRKVTSLHKFIDDLTSEPKAPAEKERGDD